MRIALFPSVVLGALLTACTVPPSVVEWSRDFVPAPKGPEFSRIDDQPDTAAVYFYRPFMPLAGLDLLLKVGDVAVAELPTDTYTVIRMRPGTYTIKTDWGALHNLSLSRSEMLSVSAGKSYYVKFTAAAIAFVMILGVRTYILSGELDEIPPDLAACAYVVPRVSLVGSE